MALVAQWNIWPPIVVSSARNVSMGPKPGDENKTEGRKLVATGDPTFPFVYEATQEEAATLGNFGFNLGS